jgi:membrane protein DedA with SNARE-associated domain
MLLIYTLAIVFVVLTCADIFYFYLGTKGALDKIKDTDAGKKIHDTIHNKIKHHVKHHSFFAVVGIKMLYGMAIIGIMYLGEKIPLRKFVFYDIVVNASLCAIVYSLVSYFDARLDAVWSGINYVQTQILLIVAALAFIYLLQRFLAKKGIKLF